ncbi:MULTISPECIES: I78 family peptidase inhibitor [Stappiaceae]|uniref:I78 family peptidase inhibitor n=1 Tax=Stappiaceae TaxID=2821832 RepID=UPI001268D2AC|nr:MULTISPECIES: I78 family peptidase inhibitor [Stappiaceae]MBO9463531.1 hypothetical protein [Labrenzia sp. R5_0]QFT01964.1 Peptidase inhibitor I78 family protein [Labrenzia sp. THAF191b]QFT07749.1 Peptidase inhibitor I78 family protein [Labrenzia sp. THAF191a]QFT19820.1 Peptidase inhibitor I78 family protein [Labrenzia sp. THAF187b]QFT71267.1 Peptidase inhibitor I78 family protein [Labrenzia sp. THAF35]
MKSLPYSAPLIIAGVALALYACSADGSAPSTASAPCNAEAAGALVGKPKPTDAEAMQLSGAKTVRQIQLGDMVTQDFREDRVTIETDPASGRVVGATCG